MAAGEIGTEILIEEANARDARWKRYFSGEIFFRHLKHGCLYADGACQRISDQISDSTALEEIYALHDAEEVYCPRIGLDRAAA